jgi:hypothetical protein
MVIEVLLGAAETSEAVNNALIHILLLQACGARVHQSFAA